MHARSPRHAAGCHVKLGARVARGAALSVLGLIVGCAAPGGAPPQFAGFDAIDRAKRTFVVIGDTQRTTAWEFWRERSAEETRLLLAEIARRDPAFVINTGDLTGWGGSAAHWQLFDREHRPLVDKRIPYFPCLGNHDYYGLDRSSLQQLFARVPALGGRTWYGIRFKEVGCVLLNSNFDVLSPQEQRAQEAWYADEMAALERDPSVRYIVVCCHHAPFSNGTSVQPSPEVEARFAAPFLRATKAAFFFTGHCHAYERFVVGGRQFIVTGGGGGPRHTLVTDERERKYDDVYRGPAIRPFHFCELELGDGCLECRIAALHADGSFREIDRVSVKAGARSGPRQSSKEREARQ